MKIHISWFPVLFFQYKPIFVPMYCITVVVTHFKSSGHIRKPDSNFYLPEGTVQNLLRIAGKEHIHPVQKSYNVYTALWLWHKNQGIWRLLIILTVWYCSSSFTMSQVKDSILAQILNCLAFDSLCHSINVKQLFFKLPSWELVDHVMLDKAE